MARWLLVELAMTSVPAAERGSRTLVRWAACAALSAALLASPPAPAQPSASDKETARSAWVDGVARRRAGDHAAALKLFRAAHAIMGLPSTGIEVARELASLGLIVEARDLALTLAKTTGQTGAEAKAVREALDLYESLGKRVATIVLEITGAPASSARIRVDGADVPAAAAEAPRRINPGTHTIVVEADGFETVERSVTLAEGGTERVAIVLARASGPLSPRGAASQTTIPRAVLDMIGRYVVLTTKQDQEIEGRLVGADDSGFTVEIYRGKSTTVARSDARSVRPREEAGGDAPAPTEPPRDAPRARPLGDGVRVHIETNDTGVSLYRHGGTSASTAPAAGLAWSQAGSAALLAVAPISSESQDFVCSAPCDAVVDGSRGDTFFLRVGDAQLGHRFRLRDLGSEVTLRATVRARPKPLRVILGAGLLGGGAAAGVVGGVLFATAGDGGNPADRHAVGGVFLGLAGVLFAVGIPLIAGGAGDYDVSLPPEAAQRFVPKVAVAPSLPLFGGGAGASASAAWQF